MDKTRKQFLFNLEWVEVLMGYPKEVRYEVYDAIMRYVASGEISELKPTAKMAFSFIKKEIDYNDEKYQSVCDRNKANGKKGGRPKKADKNEETVRFSKNRTVLEKPKKAGGFSVLENAKIPPLYDNDNDNDNDIVFDNNKGFAVGDDFLSKIGEATIEQYCMSAGMRMEVFYELAKEVLSEWNFREVVHWNESDARGHLLNQVRIKLRKKQENETKREDRLSERRGVDPGSNRAEDYSDTL